MVRQAFSVVPPILVLLLLVLPSVQAACTDETQGTLFVPTGTANPPAFSHPAITHGVSAYYVWAFAPGDYELFFNGATSSACVLSNCLDLPDFNVAWYAFGSPFDTLVRDDDERGDQTGTIPLNADYALIYMRNGPDAGTSDGSIGASFTFRTGC